MVAKIKVSIATFNEIADALAKHDVKVNEQGTLTLEKTMQLEHPYDMRLATMRRDCLVEAVKMCTGTATDVIALSRKMFQFVLTGSNKEESEDDA